MPKSQKKVIRVIIFVLCNQFDRVLLKHSRFIWVGYISNAAHWVASCICVNKYHKQNPMILDYTCLNFDSRQSHSIVSNTFQIQYNTRKCVCYHGPLLLTWNNFNPSEPCVYLSMLGLNLIHACKRCSTCWIGSSTRLYQFGVQKGKSTSTALIVLLDICSTRQWGLCHWCISGFFWAICIWHRGP